jgi:asparagine synthetase B (glutamine-hydrolysing)
MISKSLKPNCVVLDFCGTYGKHRQLTTAEILGGKISDEVMDGVMKRIKKKGGKAVQMDKEIAEEEKRIAERNRKREEEIAKRAKIKANVSYRLKEIDPFALMHISASPPQAITSTNRELSAGMKRVLRQAGFNPDEMDYYKAKKVSQEIVRRWKLKLSSPAQIKLLNKLGYPQAAEMKFADASNLITAVKNNGWRKVELSSISTTINENPF